MAYTVIPPPAPLKRYVRYFWILESNVEHYKHRSMADVCPELIFHYEGRFDQITPDGKREPSYTSGIHGPTPGVTWFQIERSFGIFGVYLYPYAIQELFGIPSREITAQQLDIFAILGREGKELEEKMFTCADNYSRFGIINNYLLRRVQKINKRYNSFYASVHRIMQSKGTLKISELSQNFCLSERQFERRFKDATGFRPKLFSKIVRFQSAFEACNSQPDKSLTAIALENGYYDQSHFIQDFKSYSGLNPHALVSGKAPGLDWLKD